MLVGLINPAAGHKPAVDLAHVLASASPRLRLVMSDREDDIDALIHALPNNPAQLLVVAGGDGTICHLITRFARANAMAHLPPLLVLPAGRVNTIASALVGSRRPAQTAQRILLAWTRGVRRLRKVPVLRVQVGDAEPWVGFTASIGALARLHVDYRNGWMQGSAGFAELLARLALQRLPPQRFAPIEGPVHALPEPITLPAVTSGVISALPQFFGFVRPFPGAQGLPKEGVRFALSALGALGTQAALPGMLRGVLRGHPQLQFGLTTQLGWTNGERPDLMVLDGEELTIPAGAEVRIEEWQRIRMVVWRELPGDSSVAM